jgi:chemotaxis signal transduction protein
MAAPSSSALSEGVDSDASRASSHGSRSTANAGAPKRICAFVLGRSLYGVDVRIVRRILPVTNAIPVPRTDSAVVGLQIQRGVAVPLLNPCELLGLREQFDAGAATTALVIESEGLHFGLTISRVDAVVTVRREDLRPRTSESEPEVIAGVYEAVGSPPQPVTLLSSEQLLKRVARLRFRAT